MFGTLEGAKMFGRLAPVTARQAVVGDFQAELRDLVRQVPFEVGSSFIGQTQLAMAMVDEALRLLETQLGRAEAKGVLRHALGR